MTLESVTPEDDFRKQYIRLRTVLDGLEATALRYCLKETDPRTRVERAQVLEKIIMPAVQEIAAISEEQSSTMGPCGEGYCWCDGVCVPYVCPGTGNGS